MTAASETAHPDTAYFAVKAVQRGIVVRSAIIAVMAAQQSCIPLVLLGQWGVHDALRVYDQDRRHVLDCPEQQPAHEAAEPPIYGLSRREVIRQHPPSAAGSCRITKHIVQIRCGTATALGHRGQERLNEQPLPIRQIGRVALRSFLKSSHRATARSDTHPKLQSRQPAPSTLSQSVSYRGVKLN